MKRQERSKRSCQLDTVQPLEARALMTLTTTAALPDLKLETGAAVAPVNLDSYFKDANPSTNFAIFNTTLGTIPVLLTPKTTPLTVANFQSYVSKGAYTNSVVHRSVPGFIWQAGGFQLSPTTQQITPTPTDPPVKNEFGASNLRGTIAMAKLGSDPNSATNQFFFNESDSNASNLDQQNGGFTVFGHVVGAQGLAVMDAVAAVPAPSPGPLASPLDSAPLQNYTAGSSIQLSNLILIKNVTSASEVFLPSSDAPDVANASVQGNTLLVSPLAPGTAHITVVGYGSDGVSATESFTVNVAPSSTQQPGTTTTPPTPLPTPIIATPPPISATPPSVLVPSARGSLPSSVVVGQKTKIQETVGLVAPSAAVVQKEQVALTLSTTSTGSPGDFTVASASAKVKLKAGQQARVSLSANHISPSVPVGTYHVLVSVIDPNGSMTTVDTGKTLNVLAARSKPSRK